MLGLDRFALAFGAPGTGAHRPRLLGLAAVDLLLALCLAALLSPLAPARNPWARLGLSAAGVAALGVAAHEAFGVRTALNSRLFGRPFELPRPSDTPRPKP